MKNWYINAIVALIPQTLAEIKDIPCVEDAPFNPFLDGKSTICDGDRTRWRFHLLIKLLGESGLQLSQFQSAGLHAVMLDSLERWYGKEWVAHEARLKRMYNFKQAKWVAMAAGRRAGKSVFGSVCVAICAIAPFGTEDIKEMIFAQSQNATGLVLKAVKKVLSILPPEYVGEYETNSKKELTLLLNGTTRTIKAAGGNVNVSCSITPWQCVVIPHFKLHKRYEHERIHAAVRVDGVYSCGFGIHQVWIGRRGH